MGHENIVTTTFIDKQLGMWNVLNQCMRMSKRHGLFEKKVLVLHAESRFLIIIEIEYDI